MDKLLNEAIQERDLLLNNMQSVVLSTLDNANTPNASYAPSLMNNDGFYIYISTLSKHSKNLMHNPKASMMIIEDESKSEKLFARKRITMDVNSNIIERDSDKWNDVMNEMESKFGDSIKYLKNMTDFYLFNLVPKSGLLVYDFGRAFKLTGENLNTVGFLNDKGHKTK